MARTLRLGARHIMPILLLATLGACGDRSVSSGANQLGRQTKASTVRHGSDRDSGDRSTTSGAEAKRVRVAVVDTAFDPAEISVTAGSEVVWNQTGRQPHSVTATEGEFDSSPDCSPLEVEACLGEGGRFSHTFDTFHFYCRVHGLPDGTGTVGVVKVRRP